LIHICFLGNDKQKIEETKTMEKAHGNVEVEKSSPLYNLCIPSVRRLAKQNNVSILITINIK